MRKYTQTELETKTRIYKMIHTVRQAERMSGIDSKRAHGPELPSIYINMKLTIPVPHAYNYYNIMCSFRR